MLHHVEGSSCFYFRDHHLLRAEGDYYCAGPANEVGRLDGSKSGISAAATVEVDVVGVGGALECTENIVAYAAGLERTAWLEVIEFEEDSASTV